MKWLIIGGGISGVGSARYLRSKGEDVVLTCKKSLNVETKDILHTLGVTVVEDVEDVTLVDQVDAIVLSPAVSFDNPFVQVAIHKYLPIFSEIDLVLKDYKGVVVAISGTNGKSTTASMIYHVLSKLNISVSLAGNIGIPLTDLYVKGELKDILVLEVSSYQLEHSKYLFPTISVLTSFSYDHISRHKTLENYFKIKWSLFEKTQSNGYVIALNELFEMAHKYKLTLSNYPTIIKIFPKDIVHINTLKTKHDQLNATYCVYACQCVVNLGIEVFKKHLVDFKTLPHRYEIVGTILGKSVINDSKSTNVECVIKALESVQEPCLLLLGGQSKSESFKPLIQYKDIIKHIFCFGEDRLKISLELSSWFTISCFSTLKECIHSILDFVVNSPMLILFSPGCASFDEFRNFEHRGDFFKKEISIFLDKK